MFTKNITSKIYPTVLIYISATDEICQELENWDSFIHTLNIQLVFMKAQEHSSSSSLIPLLKQHEDRVFMQLWLSESYQPWIGSRRNIRQRVYLLNIETFRQNYRKKLCFLAEKNYNKNLGNIEWRKKQLVYSFQKHFFNYPNFVELCKHSTFTLKYTCGTIVK